MFEIWLDNKGMNTERREDEEEEEEVGDGRQNVELLVLASFSHSAPSSPTGSGPSEPDSEPPGGRGVEAQGLVRGEEGVDPEDAPNSAGRTGQH